MKKGDYYQSWAVVPDVDDWSRKTLCVCKTRKKARQLRKRINHGPDDYDYVVVKLGVNIDKVDG